MRTLEAAAPSSKTAPAPTAPLSHGTTRHPIRLTDVITSVEHHFPLLLAVEQEREIAAGDLLASEGGFDTRLRSKAKLKSEGFYRNERVDVVFEQPTPWWGLNAYSGYRLGTGDFPVYDEEEETLSRGEMRAGLSVPLLRGGAIDQRRVDVWKARIALDAADPRIREKRLEFMRKAASAYWKWLAAGRKLAVARALLRLAEVRQNALQTRASAGDLAPIDLTDNERLIVERRTIILSAERALQNTAILLSLYYRDADGAPAIPDSEQLPAAFPVPTAPDASWQSTDREVALRQRPELTILTLELQRLELDQRFAENSVLPRLDLSTELSRDQGRPSDEASSTDDQVEFETRLSLDLPLYAREARGKLRSIRAKMRQLQAELRFAREQIVVDVQDAHSALHQSYARYEQAREAAALARQMEDAELENFAAGNSDLLRVNLREQQSAAAEAAILDATADYFVAVADYRAALGIDLTPGASDANSLEPTSR